MQVNGFSLRRHDWPALLERFIDERRAAPFAWGVNDCVTFAVDWVSAARPDLDPRRDLGARLDYTSAWAAWRTLDGHSIEHRVNEWGELLSIGVTFAQRGDLVLVESGGRQCLSIEVGGLAAGPGTGGVEFTPMTAAQRAWRV